MPRQAPDASIRPLFRQWMEATDWHGKNAVDAGCGTGAAALCAAPTAKRIVGIDIDAEKVAEANRAAQEAGWSHVDFYRADAEAVDYRGYFGHERLDAVLAHLCLSDAIIFQAGRALLPGGLFLAAAFHTDMWKESGMVSRFAYAADRLEKCVVSAGFNIVQLERETEVLRFESVDDAIRRYLAPAALADKWRADGRIAGLRRSFAGGPGTITESYLLLRAEKG